MFQALLEGNSPAVPMLLAPLAWVLLAAAPAAAEDQPGPRYELGRGVEARLQDDGSVKLQTSGEGRLLLQTEFQIPEPSQWSRLRGPADPPFQAQAREGQAGGNRGFSARADDDGDGLIDEDRLDGADNDGDGLIDEDFQAISDAMAVWELSGNGGSLHLEVYHWAYPHLRQGMFLQVDRQLEGAGDPGVLQLVAAGSEWREVEIFYRRHAPGGRSQTVNGRAWVASSEGAWLGVLFLDQAQIPGPGVQAERHRLQAPLGRTPLPLVVCAAPSWLQLNRILGEAKLVFAGVEDPVTRRRVHWITPAICGQCRLAEAPRATWLSGPGPQRQIVFRVGGGSSALIDPDLLSTPEGPLGSPVSLAWRPRAGQGTQRAWTRMTPELLDGPHDQLSDPYGEFAGVIGHAGEGELVLRFPAEVAPRLYLQGPVKLQGFYLDGRPFETYLRPGSVASGCLTDQDSVVGESSGGPLAQEPGTDPDSAGQEKVALEQFLDHHKALGLSPDLLKNYPNPFRDVTMIQFRVPGTVGEAFVLPEGEVPPSIDPAAPVPWGQGPPLVTVKIYSIDGLELATLHHGYEGPGGQTVQWNGRDAFGRPVASGTYFCKLQIGRWSVTRRLSYLR